MNCREAISQVRSAFRLNSSDVSLTDRAILSQLNGTRNLYVKQQLDKRKLWESPNIFTPLKVELEPARMADFPEFQSDCMVARSKHKLPQILDSGNFNIVTSGLYTLDKKRKFTEVSPLRYVNLLRLGLPGNNVYYWMFNDYLWVSKSEIDSVILPAFVLGEVPNEFSLDGCDVDNPCPPNPLDAPWRCPEFLTQAIITATADFYNKTYKRSAADTSSDDQDQTK